MSEPGQGRARGRGGRGKRPQPQDGPGSEAPGAAPPEAAPGLAAPRPMGRGRARARAAQVDPTEAHPQPVLQSAEPDAIGGRGVQRGGAREQADSGSGAGLATEMGRLDVSGRPDYQRREPYSRFTEKVWKEENTATQGKSGQPVNMAANYFPVTLSNEKKIFQYHVDFKPPIENIKVKFAMICKVTDQFKGIGKLFDGGILYLNTLLPSDPYVVTAERNYDNTPVQIIVTKTCEVMKTSPQFLQITNVLMKKIQIKLGMRQIRDHYFDMNKTIRIAKHQLEVCPGFTTAIAKFDGGNLLGVDIIHKILRMDNVHDHMSRLYAESGQGQFQNACAKEFVGAIVLTRYNNKTYKVDDIAWDMSPSSTFEKNGEQVSYTDYYAKNWDKKITDVQQPLLVSRPTEKDRRRGDEQNLYLIPELCTITGLSEKARSDFRIMQDLAVHTRINPKDRVATLQTFSSQINSNAEVQTLLNPWNMVISPKVAQLSARELPAEQLLMSSNRGGHQKISYDIKQADWSRNMRGVKMLAPIQVENWVIIFPTRERNVTSKLNDCLIRVAQAMGMNMSQPTVIEMNQDRNENYLQAIRQNLTPQTQIMVCVVPNDKKDRYDAIKKSCCIDNPVPSQVVKSRTISNDKGLMSVATKIAIQMNCKMGGEVWGADIPIKGLMIIGIDTYHDSANKNQSVGAMVASLNQECTRFYCKTEYHDKKSEIMQSLSVLVAGALRKYHETNQANPAKVIVYRDGVGDGQLDVVYNSEKEQITQAFRIAGGADFKPKLAMVIVKKRIMTRFFRPDQREGFVNPQPGTIIDSFVTKDEWYDFFLVSQSVRQGTVSPTSYNVIFDDTGFQPDHIQRLTYKLTHLYFNWQGTIRVPSVCQYAHKLAFLQGQSLHREFSAHLSDKLFFL